MRTTKAQISLCIYAVWSVPCSLVQNSKTLASLGSWAGGFESYLVANPENRFSHDVAHTVLWIQKNRLWYMSYVMRKPVFGGGGGGGLATRYDSNQPAQLQILARVLKFEFSKYTYDTIQAANNCCFVVRICHKQVFSRQAHIKEWFYVKRVIWEPQHGHVISKTVL